MMLLLSHTAYMLRYILCSEYQSIMCICVCIVCVDVSVYMQYIWEYTHRVIIISKSYALLVELHLHFSHLEGVPPSTRFGIKPCNSFWIFNSSSQVLTVGINTVAVLEPLTPFV